MSSKIVSLIDANNNTTAILIKLLATNIVANNFLGRSKSFAIINMGAEFCSKPSLISDLVKENKATSAPDINAEQTRRTISNILLAKKDVLISNTFITKTVGSGSKIKI